MPGVLELSLKNSTDFGRNNPCQIGDIALSSRSDLLIINKYQYNSLQLFIILFGLAVITYFLLKWVPLPVKSVIKSKAAMTYSQANDRLNDLTDKSELTESIRNLNKIAKQYHTLQKTHRY